ncbi:MAG: zinc-ribbon domain-containing protein [Clostridiales bacterium]|nr:zinc-ribbon domain-containing protein [Clostridiales bacterium]
MEQITFTGDNKNLFSRRLIENVDAKLSIIVPETHTAIFIKDGQMLQTLSSGKYKITEFVDIKTEANCSLELLFMSKTAKLRLLWGTASKILAFDRQLKENYHIGLSGDFEVQIGDPRKCYLYLVGAEQNLTADGLQERLMSKVVSVVEQEVLSYIDTKQILFNQIILHKKEMSAQVLNKLSQKLMNEYGITVFSFNIANIIIDEEDLQNMTTSYKGGSTQVCKSCQTALAPNSKFCHNCGKKVSQSKLCPKCKSENVDDSKFCTSCGSSFVEEE